MIESTEDRFSSGGMKRSDPIRLVILLERGLAPSRRNRIRRRLERHGVEARFVEGEAGGYLEVCGDDLPVRSLRPEHWAGVRSVVPLTPEYPHASWGGGSGDLASPTLVMVGLWMGLPWIQ